MAESTTELPFSTSMSTHTGMSEYFSGSHMLGLSSQGSGINSTAESLEDSRDLYSRNGPEIVNTYFENVVARRTEVEDVPIIQRLSRSPWTEIMFGHVHLYDVVEQAVLAVTLESARTTIIAQAAFFDYPNLWKVDPALLEEWLESHCGQSCPLTPLNTVFFSYFVSLPGIEIRCAYEVVKAMFNTLVDVNYVVLIVPKTVTKGTLSEVFSEGFPSQSYDLYSLRYCSREAMMPKIKIRRARVEDSDDLMALFGRQTEVLKSFYGEYFLAEMIEQQDNFDICLVAETNSEVPIGFMSISKNVDVNTAEKHYELTPFNRLRKVYTPPKVEVKVEVAPKKGRGVEKGKETGKGGKEGEVSLQPVKTVQEPVIQEPSAFCIHLFAMKEEYESSYMLFVQEGFHIFHDKEFCVVSVPCWSSGAAFLQKFVQVTPKATVPMPQELYVLHRWCLMSTVRVRPARFNDKDKVDELTKNLESSQDLLSDFVMCCTERCNSDGVELQAFVFECLAQIAGVAIICQEEEIEFIRSRFNVDEHIYFGLHRREDHSRVLHCLLNPIFASYSRHFLKEIFRLGRKSCLYVRVYGDTITSRHKTILTIAREFLPVPYRKTIESFSRISTNNLPSVRCSSSVRNFMLTLLSRKHVLETKITIRAQIIIVGPSDAAFALLKSFLESPYVKLTNIYLVTPVGIPSEEETTELSHVMIPDNPLDPLLDMNSAFLRLNIGLIPGKMTGIHRSKKCITVNRTFEVYYDYLILCCGRQYRIPRLLHDSSKNYKVPSNIFTVNTHTDAKLVAEKVSAVLTEEEKAASFLVYGNTLEAFAFVEGLLRIVPGQTITIVEPVELLKDFCIQEGTIRSIINRNLTESHVRHYAHCELQYCEQDDEIGQATFSTESGMKFDITYHLMFCFSEINVKQDTFNAINEASLVYDGGVVINEEFRTNDSWIFAAGPLTKFSRRFYTNISPQPDQLCSRTAGRMLASQLHRILNPAFILQHHQFFSSPADLMQAMTGPVIINGRLPGGINCFHMCQSGRCAYNTEECVQELVTGTVVLRKQPYVRLCINSNGKINSITCLSKNDVNSDVWCEVFGMYIDFFNDLLTKYEDGLINDLHSYFSEPWCCAILHDRFKEYWNETKKLFCRKLLVMPAISNRFRKIVTGELELSENERRNLEVKFEAAGTHQEMTDLLISFLHYNQSLLSMYAIPDTV